jgi:hypothetical protein
MTTDAPIGLSPGAPAARGKPQCPSPHPALLGSIFQIFNRNIQELEDAANR